MNVRAVIFDVYHTLLEISPPPADAARRWEFLCQDKLAKPPRLSLEEFAAACATLIEREHAAALAVGVAHPEIYWPAIAAKALPELARLSEAECDEFLYQHAQLQRTVRLVPEAAEVLAALAQRKTLLGIASNAQPYTLRELDTALATAGLSRSLFQPELCFWSFAFGFSKPDPHVFRLLSARLSAQGVGSDETLIVGDRPDNDIEPARAQGWRTWRLTPPTAAPVSGQGDWKQFVQCYLHSV
jgi:FMN phosphatase YigB (HAD superfamily)